MGVGGAGKGFLFHLCLHPTEGLWCPHPTEELWGPHLTEGSVDTTQQRGPHPTERLWGPHPTEGVRGHPTEGVGTPRRLALHRKI